MGPAGPSAGLVNLDMEGDQGAGSSVPTLGPWGVEASVLVLEPHGLRVGKGTVWTVWHLVAEPGISTGNGQSRKPGSMWP